ncbi:MAG: hypothetical protein ACLFQV_02545 [Vulcanimicrobiota bacterium]
MEKPTSQNEENEILEEYIEEYLDIEDSDVISYLFYVSKYLQETNFQDVEMNEVDDALQEMFETVSHLKDKYSKPAPRGGKNTRLTVREIIEILERGIEQLGYYLDSEDQPAMLEAMELFTQASQAIDALRDGIAQQRLEIADLLSKLGKGIIKEGDVIEDETERLYISDEDLLSDEPDEEPEDENPDYSTAILEDNSTESENEMEPKPEDLPITINSPQSAAYHNLQQNYQAFSSKKKKKELFDISDQDIDSDYVDEKSSHTWKEEHVFDNETSVPSTSVEVDEENPDLDGYSG